MLTKRHKVLIGHSLRDTYILKPIKLLAVVELKRLFSGELEFRGLSHESFEVSGRRWLHRGC